MKTYFISDTHFGHKNVLKYDNAPFDSIEEYNAAIVQRWNETVSDDDIVYHLGDVSLTSSKERLLKYIAQLKGRKRLVMGNHDIRNVNFYYEAGFERVYDHPIILQNFFILSHEPMFMTENMPYYNIYGHVHTHPSFKTETENTICVCACRHDYRPIIVDAWERFDPEAHKGVLSF